jgi:hypothetical protein
MMKTIFSLCRGRCLHAAVLLGALSILSACGGSGAVAEGPRFEATTLAGVSAIKDNATGVVWATQLGGAAGTAPTAQELLTVADLSTDVLTTHFSFLFNKRVQVAEPVVGDNTRAWVVDFRVDPAGVHRLGGLSDEAVPDAVNPISQWRVLQRPASVLVPTEVGDGYLVQRGLMWSLCSVGTSYIAGRCDGQPTALSLEDAKLVALRSQLLGFTDWRVPTKQELQSQLSLGNSQGSLLPGTFASKDVLSPPLQYWTSSSYSFPSPNTPGTTLLKHWVVDFQLGLDLGGVELVEPDLLSLVRLVRTMR